MKTAAKILVTRTIQFFLLAAVFSPVFADMVTIRGITMSRQAWKANLESTPELIRSFSQADAKKALIEVYGLSNEQVIAIIQDAREGTIHLHRGDFYRLFLNRPFLNNAFPALLSLYAGLPATALSVTLWNVPPDALLEQVSLGSFATALFLFVIAVDANTRRSNFLFDSLKELRDETKIPVDDLRLRSHDIKALGALVKKCLKRERRAFLPL